MADRPEPPFSTHASPEGNFPIAVNGDLLVALNPNKSQQSQSALQVLTTLWVT